jgi:FixJ family two-component response regulator/anti-sigma regulatory factor (Ser/Thr protein kinase)
MTNSLRVLLIDDEKLVRDELGGLLVDEGYQLTTASDGEEGLVRFRSDPSDMVITDVRMPCRDGLSLAMSIRQEAPNTPITIITGHGSETMVLEALRAGVTDFIKKPVRFPDLCTALLRMEAALNRASQRFEDLPDGVEVLERRWVYRLGNDLPAVPRFVDALLRHAAPSWPSVTLNELGAALRELLVNAIEHGNLGLTYDEKAHALGRGDLRELLVERSAVPGRASLRTTVTVLRAERELRIRIRDEGSGFDWRRLPDPTDPANLLADHGRGVLLASLAVDELAYNEVGNEVTLVKRGPAAPDRQSAASTRSRQTT